MGRDLYGPAPRKAAPSETGISRRALFGLRLSDRARADIDYDGVTARVVAAWEAGGHEALLRATEPVAQELAEAAAIEPGQRVLDAGAGDGNVARAALARGARVTACDLSPAMLAAGRSGAPDATWVLGDVQALPFADEGFDVVVSAFAFALAPRARRTAAELARVVRPGGAVALGAWVPRGLPGRFAELAEQRVPLPDGVRSPADWGVQDAARRRLEPLLDDLVIRLRTVRVEFGDGDALLEALARAAGLSAEDRTAVRPAFDRLLASCNTDPVAIALDARYLMITGRRPG